MNEALPKGWEGLAHPINWETLVRAMRLYEKRGFVYRETPWAVPAWAMAFTKPPTAKDTFVLSSGLELVASAEQGFMYQDACSLLPSGRHMSLTPCFRGEPEFDEWHYPYFMKLELWASIELESVQSMAEHAFVVMTALGMRDLLLVETPIGFDLESKGVELGSYGLRVIPEGHGRFIYGTGLAEPRFSRVCTMPRAIPVDMILE